MRNCCDGAIIDQSIYSLRQRHGIYHLLHCFANRCGFAMLEQAIKRHILCQGASQCTSRFTGHTYKHRGHTCNRDLSDGKVIDLGGDDSTWGGANEADGAPEAECLRLCRLILFARFVAAASAPCGVSNERVRGLHWGNEPFRCKSVGDGPTGIVNVAGPQKYTIHLQSCGL